MNQFPHQGSQRQFPQRNVQPGSLYPRGTHVPPPPLPPTPPWFNQPNTVIPPPPVPPHFTTSHHIPSQQFPPSFAATFPPPPFPQCHPGPPAFRPPGEKQGCLVTTPSEDERTSRPSENQVIVNNWLRSRTVVKTTTEKRLSYPKVQLRDVRGKVNGVMDEMRGLENDLKTLAVMLKTVTPAEWDSKCDEIESKKRTLSRLLRDLEFSDKESRVFREKCLKRSKKRGWLKRKKEIWKRQKEEEKERIDNRHVQLDNWLKEMQEGVERTQREEELKKEADAVLWGITRKKNECRRQISLLSALLELREVRVKRLTATGNPVSQSQIQTFDTVIERLKKMWGRQMEECLLEEQVLRGMLTQQEVKEDPLKTYKKLVLQEWEKAIFGSATSPDTDIKGDELIRVRHSWDQFAVPVHMVLSTTVPPGWVLPVPPANQDWHHLLKY